MGNCISKINKGHFFAFREEIKNDIQGKDKVYH